jgi:transcriptional regulator with XRE-family HTH domain
MKTIQLDDVVPSLSFLHFLQGELATRCARNRQYSLRAFAKFLGMDHSTLSQLLRGKRASTERIIRQCAVPLGLEEASVTNFVRGSLRESNLDDAALREVRRLASDTASLVADWEHYAILELVRLREFRPDSRWIARVLGLSVDEVNVALQRLLRLGLLTMDEPDHWTDQSGDTTASVRGFTREALKRLVDHSRERLLEIVGSPADARCVFSETTLAVPSVCIPEIAQRVEKVRREIQSIVERAGPPDEVYRLEINFGPLTTVNQIT